MVGETNEVSVDHKVFTLDLVSMAIVAPLLPWEVILKFVNRPVWPRDPDASYRQALMRADRDGAISGEAATLKQRGRPRSPSLSGGDLEVSVVKQFRRVPEELVCVLLAVCVLVVVGHRDDEFGFQCPKLADEDRPAGSRFDIPYAAHRWEG